jgi:hypothetical protein
MSIYKIWRHARESGDFSSNPLLRVLYRDGVLYFVVRPYFIQPTYHQPDELTHIGDNGCVPTIACFLARGDANHRPTAIRVFNLICWLIFPVSLLFLGVFILWSLIIVMINRLFLNLRSNHKPEKESEEDNGTEAEEGPSRTHTPFTCRKQGQRTNIFGGGTFIRDEEFSIISPTATSGAIGIRVTRTEERWSKPMDSLWLNPVPMPAKAHVLFHLPLRIPLSQMQMDVRKAPTTSPIYEMRAWSMFDQVGSPQKTTPSDDDQSPLQRRESSPRMLVPRQNSGD